MRKLLNTLFITSEQAYLTLDGETVCVEIQKKKAWQFPLHTLEGIISFSYNGATPALMGACAKRGINLAFFNPFGKFLCRVAGKAEEMCYYGSSSIGSLITKIPVALLQEISYSEKYLIVGGQLTELYEIMNYGWMQNAAGMQSMF